MSKYLTIEKWKDSFEVEYDVNGDCDIDILTINELSHEHFTDSTIDGLKDYILENLNEIEEGEREDARIKAYHAARDSYHD